MDENGDAEGNYTVVSLLPMEDDDSLYPDNSVGATGVKGNTSDFSFGDYSSFFSSFEGNQAYVYWDPHSNTTVRLSMQPVGYFTQTVPSSPASASSTSTFPGVSSTGTTTTHQKSDSTNNNDLDKADTPAEDVFVSCNYGKLYTTAL